MLHSLPLLLVFVGVLAPSVPSQAPSSQQSDTDKRYAALMQAARGRSDPAVTVPQLEQFIRECPEYPNLDQVYTTLLSKLLRFAPDRVSGVADEFLIKFPGSRFRASVYETKFSQLKAQKDEERITALGLLVLGTESNPEVLDVAAGYDATSRAPTAGPGR